MPSIHYKAVSPGHSHRCCQPWASCADTQRWWVGQSDTSWQCERGAEAECLPIAHESWSETGSHPGWGGCYSTEIVHQACIRHMEDSKIMTFANVFLKLRFCGETGYIYSRIVCPLESLHLNYLWFSVEFPLYSLAATGIAASLPVKTCFISIQLNFSIYIPILHHWGDPYFLYPSKHFYKCKQALWRQLQRRDLPRTWERKQHVSPGPGPRSKHSCVEYFPHSSVHLGVIRAQLAPRTWRGKQTWLSKQTNPVRKTGIWASDQWCCGCRHTGRQQLGWAQRLHDSSWLDLVLAGWENKIP